MDTFSELMDRLGVTTAGGHVHEYTGNTDLAGQSQERHNHRLAGVTGPAIPWGSSHVHGLEASTGGLGHCHRLAARTAAAVDIGGGKHVHPCRGLTSLELDHAHRFELATLVEANPV